MRKLKEVLRLHQMGLGQREIARCCSTSQSTVHNYLKRAETAGVEWPLPADVDPSSRRLVAQTAHPAVETHAAALLRGYAWRHVHVDRH